jgi:uncharacterized protein YdiU (UPF0061 family)
MQPRIGEWTCYALGQAMIPLIGEVDDVQEALSVYKPAYADRMDALWHAKLGLSTAQEGDEVLIGNLLQVLAANRVDFTLFFRRLSHLALDNPSADEPLRDLFIDRGAFDAWSVEYRRRLRAEGSKDAIRKETMNRVNPKYILRNYLAQVAIDKAAQKDFSEVARLLAVLQQPFDEQPEHEAYAALPPDWAAGIEVSCSS